MVEIKNGQLVMYDVTEKYKDYLRKFDNRVSQKENRKFYGIIVTNNDIGLLYSFYK